VADNRRSSTRHNVSLPIRVVIDGAERTCTMTNLSLGGAQFETAPRITLGARLQCSFKLPTFADTIEVGGTVRWSDEKATGVQFDGLRAREVWALTEFFKQLLEAS
jgi:hypothetical protein